MKESSATFREPWKELEGHAYDHGSKLEGQAKSELTEGHPLFGKKLKALAFREDRDDVVFQLGSGPEVACVHLTWSGKQIPPFPHAKIYSTISNFLTCEAEGESDAT